MPDRRLPLRSFLAGLAAVLALSAVLSYAVSDVLRGEALAEATRSGELAASFVQHGLDPAAFDRELTAAERSSQDVPAALRVGVLPVQRTAV